MPLPDLDITLKPSRFYGLGLCALHLLTYLALLNADFSQPLYTLIWVLVLLLTLRSWRHWRALTAWHRLIVQSDGIQLLGAYQARNGVLGAQTLQTAWVIILPLRLDSGAMRLPVLPDSVSSEDWRRLRVWLNTGAQEVKH